MLHVASLRRRGTMGQVVRGASESRYTGRCAAIEAEIKRLQEAVRVMSMELDRSEDVRKSNSNLTTIINERLGEIERLKAQIEKITRDHASNLKAALEQQRMVESRLTALTAEKEALESGNFASSAKLAADIEETNKQVADLTRQLEISNKEHETSKARVASLESEKLNQAPKTRVVYSLASREKKHRSIELKFRITELLARSIRREDTIRRLRAQAQIKLNAQIEYRDAIRDKIRELGRLKEKGSKDARTIGDLNSEIEKLHARQNEISSQLGESKSELANLTRLHESSTEERDSRISELNSNVASLQEEARVLKQEAERKDMILTEFQSEKTSLKSRLDLALATRDDLAKAIRETEESGSKKDTEIARLEKQYLDESEKVAERIADLYKLLETVGIAIQNARGARGSILEELSSAKKTIKAQVDELRLSIRKSEKLVNSVSRAGEKHTELTHQNNELKSRQARLTSEIDQLKVLLESGTQKGAELREKLQAARLDMDRLNSQIEDLSNKIGNLEQELTRKQASYEEEIVSLIQKLTESVSIASDLTGRVVPELDAEKTSLQSALREAKATIESLSKDIAETKKLGSKKDSQIARLKKQYKDESEKVAELKSRVTSLDSAISSQTKEALDVSERIATLDALLMQVQSSIGSARGDRESLLGELSSAKKTIETKTNEIETARDNVHQLEQRLSQATKKHAELTTENNTLTSLQAKLTSEITKLKGLLESGTQNEAELQEKLQAANLEMDTIKSKIDISNSKIGDLEKQLAQTRSDHTTEITNLKRKLDDSVTEASRATEQVASLQVELTSEQDSKKQALEYVEHIKKEIESCSATSEQLLRESTRIRKDLDDVKNTAAKAHKTKEEIESAKALLEANVFELQQKISTMKADALRQLETAKASTIECESRNEELRRELEAHKQKQQESADSMKQKLDESNASLHGETKKRESLASRVRELESELKKSKEDVSKSKEEQALANDELKRITNINDELKGDLAHKEKIIAMLKKKESAKTEVHDTRETLLLSRTRAASPEKLSTLSPLETPTVEYNHERVLKVALDRKDEGIQSKIDTLTLTKTRLESQVAQLERELSKTTAKCDTMEATIKSLEAALRDLDDKARSQDEANKAEIRSLKTLGGKSIAQLELKEEEMRQLKAEAADARGRLSACEISLGASQNKVTDEQQSKQAAEILLMTERSKLSHFSHLCAGEESHQKCARNLSKIKDLLTGLCDGKDDVDELDNCTERLNHAKRTLSYVQKLDTSASSASTSQVSIDAIIKGHLEREVSAATYELERELSEAQTKAGSFESKVSELRAKVGASEKSKQEIETLLQTKSDDLETKENLIAQIKQQLSQNATTIGEMEKQQVTLQAKIEELTKSNETLETNMSDVRAKLQDGLANARVEVDQARAQSNLEISDLQSRNDEQALAISELQNTLVYNNSESESKMRALRDQTRVQIFECQKKLEDTESAISELRSTNVILEGKLKRRDDSNDATLGSIIQAFIHRTLKFRTKTIGKIMDEAATYDEINRRELIEKFDDAQLHIERHLKSIGPQLQSNIKTGLAAIRLKMVNGVYNQPDMTTKSGTRGKLSRPDSRGSLDSVSTSSVGSNEQRAGKKKTDPPIRLLRGRLNMINESIKDRSWVDTGIPALIRLKRQVDEYEMTAQDKQLLSMLAAFIEEPYQVNKRRIAEDITKLRQGIRIDVRAPASGSLEEYIQGIAVSDDHSISRISDAELTRILKSDKSAIEFLQLSELDSIIEAISGSLDELYDPGDDTLAKLILMTHLIDLIKFPRADESAASVTIISLKSALHDTPSAKNPVYSAILDEIRQEVSSSEGTGDTLFELKRKIISLIDGEAPRVQPQPEDRNAESEKIRENLLKFQKIIDQQHQQHPGSVTSKSVPPRPRSAAPVPKSTTRFI